MDQASLTRGSAPKLGPSALLTSCLHQALMDFGTGFAKTISQFCLFSLKPVPEYTKTQLISLGYENHCRLPRGETEAQHDLQFWSTERAQGCEH